MKRLLPLIIPLLCACAAAAQTGDAARFGPVKCAGDYAQHLQGVCTNGRDAIYWSFTTALVKTDSSGAVVEQIDVPSHHGDLCYRDGRIYVAVNFGKFNDPQGHADGWIYVYDAGDLSLVAKHPTPQVLHGAGGIAHDGGRFLVVGGLPEGIGENYLYEYDGSLQFVKKHVLPSGSTRLGIQTAEFAGESWWFGCYGGKLLTADRALRFTGGFDFDCAYGVVSAGGNGEEFLVARDVRNRSGRHVAELAIARPDAERGLVVGPGR